MPPVPFCDLRPNPSLLQALSEAANEVLRSGRYINGPNVSALESEVAHALGVPFAVGVNSGTDALLLSLQSLGVGPGDEVITSPFTFFATAEVISRLGATPVFVDIDLASFCLSPSGIEAALTKRTKAIVPVHLFGHAAPMKEILALAAAHRLVVIEDAAQAFGGALSGQKLGSFGDAGAFSFFPTKNLGGFGDAGMIVTHREELAAHVKALRVHGMRKKFFPEELGYNSRLDELQAALLRRKLLQNESDNEARREAAARYHSLLSGLPSLVLPSEQEGVRHVYHLYTVRVLHEKRAFVQEALSRAQIETAVYYPAPLHTMPLFSKSPKLPNAELAAQQVLSLPLWPEISEEAQRQVAQALQDALS